MEEYRLRVECGEWEIKKKRRLTVSGDQGDGVVSLMDTKTDKRG